MLREAGVVDAGGKGFVRMIEGVVRYIEGDPILPIIATNGTSPASPSAPAALVEVAAERDFRFCTEVLVRGEQLPTSNEARASLHAFGGSLVVAVAGDILKIHVHTDTPEAVFSYASRWGRVETTKADDMRAQHRRLAHPGRRAVAVVTDSSADLSDSVLDRHGISLVPLQVVFGDTTFRDRVELKPEEFYRRLRDARDLPTTSQPAPGEFVRVFRDARAEAEEIVGVLLSAGLSGTYRFGPGGSSRGRRLRGPSGRQPFRVPGRGDAGVAGRRAGRGGVGRRAIAAELERVRSRIGHAADRRPVRQPAPVGPGLPGQGVDRRDARREADPVAR